MNWFDFIFRIFVFCISLPFGAVFALIPAAFGGEILNQIGIPLDWGRWIIGIIATLWFCLYMQAQIFPSEAEIEELIKNPEKLKTDHQERQTNANPLIWFLLGYWFGKK